MSSQKPKKISIRTGHFEKMTFLFRAGSLLHGTYTLVGLDTEGHDAVPAITTDGPRKLSMTFNPNSYDLTISETRGATSSAMRKGVMLPAGSYTVIENRIQDENTWLLTPKSSLPIQIQHGDAENGELLVRAQRKQDHTEVTKITQRMRESLVLGKREPWFALRTVNHVEIRVPDCDNSNFVDINEVVRVFDRFKATEQDQSLSADDKEDREAANETGWDDDQTMRVDVKDAAKKQNVSDKPLDLEETPDNWFDELENLTVKD